MHARLEPHEPTSALVESANLPDNPIIRTIDPRNPTGERTTPAILPNDLLLRFYKFNPVKYENARAVKEVLENPQRIFEGLRELNAGWFCYTGRPKNWYKSEEAVVPFPQELVFAVCMNDRLWIYEWRAEQADQEDKVSPAGWKDRFTRLVWTSTS